MADLVALAGSLAVYVYRRKPIIRELVDDHVIDITSRLYLPAYRIELSNFT